MIAHCNKDQNNLVKAESLINAMVNHKSSVFVSWKQLHVLTWD